MKRPLTAQASAAFKAKFAERYITSEAVREHHGVDESAYDKVLPDAVIYAQTIDDVIAAVNLCREHNLPLIAFGIGSSLEGHVLPVEGGISLDLSEMNKVLSVNTQDFTVTVEPGVLRKQLNDEIKDTGLFFPIDPGANASIGGMASTRASGTNAVKYATMRENVVSLKVVTPDGKLIRTSSHAMKSSAGYDLTRLFIGSEGTLGVIVEVTVRIYPIPEFVTAAICAFPSIEEAVNCTVQIKQCGVNIGRVEFMDANAVRAVNKYSNLTLKESPLLLFEFHGSSTGIQEQIELVKEISQDNNGADFEWASQLEERNRLWTARHNAYFASLQLRPGSRSITTDVCVPISNLAQCIIETSDDLAQLPLPWTIVGHVGDGNFHVLMMIDPESERERQLAEALNQRLVQRAITLEGSCTGEHGIGLHKMDFLRDEHGEDMIDLMRRIKQVFDPQNIMNPGKMFSWDA